MEKWVDEDLVEDMLEQHAEHGPLLIAYDFDNTVSPYKDRNGPEVLERSRQLIREAKTRGHVVYCYTANPNTNRVRKFLSDNEVPMDYLNEAPFIGAASKVPAGGGKLYYNLFLDDKCGLKSAQDTLEEFLKRTA